MAGSRKILAALADTHGGHKLGLLNPAVTLYDEDEDGQPVPYTPALTATQKYLWRCYEDDKASVVDLAAGDPIIVILNGDICHGDKYPQQLVSTRRADQILIAAANMRPWLELNNVTTARLVQGTASHTFKEATAPIMATELLRAQFPGKDIATLRHGLATIGGVVIDYAHHGPTPGIRQWTHGNQLRYYLKSLMNDEIHRGRRPPRIVLRAHFHSLAWETVRMNTTSWGMVTSDIFVLPSYCGLSEYGQQATRSAYLINHGLIAYEIEGGRLQGIHPLCRTVDLRTEEEL